MVQIRETIDGQKCRRPEVPLELPVVPVRAFLLLISKGITPAMIEENSEDEDNIPNTFEV